MNGNWIRGISLVPSTGPWVGHRPLRVWTSAAMTHSFPKPNMRDLIAERQPAESAEREQQAADPPGPHDEQISAGEARPGRVGAVSNEQGSGEMSHRED